MHRESQYNWLIHISAISRCIIITMVELGTEKAKLKWHLPIKSIYWFYSGIPLKSIASAIISKLGAITSMTFYFCSSYFPCRPSSYTLFWHLLQIIGDFPCVVTFGFRLINTYMQCIIWLWIQQLPHHICIFVCMCVYVCVSVGADV